MSYLHISNLYREQDILLFKECYALEKIHGTSAHITWDGKISFSSGGVSHAHFVQLFDEQKLVEVFTQKIGQSPVVIYGEAYGGSCQKQAWRYGKDLRFVVFEIKIGDLWLSVPQAEDVAKTLGLEFVPYKKISTDLDAINAERDALSEQARRNGVEGDQPREGVVLRPLIELVKNNGERIIAKHKRDEERETTTPREVVDPAMLAILDQASAIASEWVTPMRLTHVLDKLPQGIGIEKTREVILAMIDDVLREAAGEIVDSRKVRAAISQRTAELFKARLKEALHG